MKYVGYVFGGDVLRFFHGGDECLTIPSTWSNVSGQKFVNTIVNKLLIDDKKKKKMKNCPNDILI